MLAVLEAGMSLIAVNLPSLWYFHNNVTPEKIIRSIRSIASLGSRTSGESAKSNTEIPQAHEAQKQDSFSATSEAELMYPHTKGPISGAYAVSDVSPKPEERKDMSPGKIQVTDSFEQKVEKA